MNEPLYRAPLRHGRARLRFRPLVQMARAAVLAAVLAACGQSPPPDLTLESVEATSSTSLRLGFSAALTDGADEPGNYLVRDPDGVPLPVIAAHPMDGGRTVVLATEPQREVAYRVTVRNVTASGGVDVNGDVEAPTAIRGSSVPSPFPARAVALSNTLLLVSYDDPGADGPATLNDDALDVAAYTVTAPSLEIEGAAFSNDGDDRSRVLLTTSPMANATYTVRVGAVTADPGGRLADPFRSEVSFEGIPPTDETPPSIVEAWATDNATVLVRFSEPVQDSAGDPSRYAVADAAGTPLPVSAVDLQVHGTRALLTTSPMVPEMTYTVAARDVVDQADNPIDASATVPFVGVVAGGDTTPPRVTGATSTSATRVLVTFSEPVRGGAEGAENPEHYDVIGTATLERDLATQAIVDVTAADLADDGRSVALTTRAQSEIAYTLRVVGVRDLSGNALTGVDRDNPFEVEFFGTAGDTTDCDADGLSDADEQRGWIVTITEADGSETRREVTSDPCDPDGDTDDDGVLDVDEKRYRTDPRRADSDDDGLTDARELNQVYSEPTVVDTDGDGLADGLEVDFFTTSPLFADTDGDQLDDGYEATTDNRNPRIADLPVVEIDVGNVDLQLDVRFDERSSEGTTTVDTKNVSTTMERSRSSSRERVNSSTLEGFFSAYATGCYGGACASGGETVGNWGLSATVGGGFSTSETWTNTTASAQSTQNAYANSLTTEAQASAETTIERVVEGASMAVEVSITNPGNVAYTVRDIEITALIQNGRDASSLVPVATLFAPSTASIGVGPLNPTRGPFRFVADGIFPQLVEQLMQNPRGIVFRVANYTLEDEAGRRFAFVQQDVVDRTAGFSIDYAGNQPGESYRVATNSTFEPSGAPTGLSMADVLEGVLGLTHVPAAEDAALNPADFADAELIDSSYSTRIVNGVEVLYRVRDVSSALTGEDREWWVITSEDGLITPVADNPGRDFRSVTVLSETSFVFKFVQDLDGDGIEKAVESTYGSVDSALDTAADPDVPDSFDTDDDGLADGVEPFGPFVGNDRQPWTIRFDDGRDAYQTSSNPARVDTDGDGLSDCQELLPTDDGTATGTPLACSLIDVHLDADGLPTLDDTGTPWVSLRLPNPTDPAAIDTDGDGLTDTEELLGFRYEGLDGQTIDLRPTASGPATNPLSRDTDDDGLADRLELQLGSDPTNGDEDSVIDEDGDGLVNLQETSGRPITWVEDGLQRSATVTSLVDVVDSDGDGLTDWEEYHGCRDVNRDLTCDDDVRFGPTNPQSSDTDGDGLSDRAEVDGVDFPGDDGVRFTDPRDDDSDGDGRTDGAEIGQPWTVDVTGSGGYRVWSDPLLPDADGDGLTDTEEISAGTDPAKADSDGDGALDALELGRVTDPLTPDHLVTVTYLSIQAGKDFETEDADGDAGSAGDFGFSLDVLVPDANGILQRNAVAWPAALGLRTCVGPSDHGCEVILDGRTYIQIGAPRSVNVYRSTSFGLPFTSAFSLSGFIQEMGPEGDTYVAQHSFYFGGASDGTATYSGSSLEKGTKLKAFTQEKASYRVDVTAQITVE